MKLTSEKSLENFEFWSGAKDLADKLSHKELQTIESILEDAYPDGMSESELNDMFWFEKDTIAGWLGYENGEYLLFRDDPHYLLGKASEMIDMIRDDMVPEFDEDDLKEYFDRTGTDMDMFLNKNGYKDYIAEISDCSVEEAEENNYFVDYEDTLTYLYLGTVQDQIEDAKETRDSWSDHDLAVLGNAVVDILEKNGQDLSYEDSERAEKIAEDLEKTLPEMEAELEM